ncbi:MAG: hypothetical protein ABR585_01520 [Gemmatimonadaceae bacterium]
MKAGVCGLLGVFALSHALVAAAQPLAPSIRKTNLARDTYLFSAGEGNLVLYDGAGGSVMAGVLSPTLVAAAQGQVALHAGRRLLYAIALVSDSAAIYVDAGLGSRGTVTIAHENLRHRMTERAGSHGAAPLSLPSIGFSEVIQVYVPGEDIHAVHQHPGYSDADVSVHFERAGVLVLGNIFTADGYPAIDSSHGGSFAGLLESTTTFANNFGTQQTIVPARGAAVTGRVLRDYVAMLTAVRNKVQQLVSAGRTLEQVRASHPTAEFDARWAHGPVSADTFVESVYSSLRKS